MEIDSEIIRHLREHHIFERIYFFFHTFLLNRGLLSSANNYLENVSWNKSVTGEK